MKSYNVLDLFSGIGGFTLGLQQAGIKHNWLGYSEIDPYAKKVFRRHYEEAEDLGSVTNVRAEDLPRIDIVTFGSPCQDFSNAGKRGGLEANRSGLFYEAMRIVRTTRPKYFIFENVKGIFSSKGGQDFRIVLQEIADSGYDGQWELLDSRYVLPQSRERMYFVGHIRGERRPEIFPIKDIHRRSNEEQFQVKTAAEKEWDLQYSNSGWRREGYTGGVNTSQFNMRRLTPIEYERLQGFPDGWTKGNSDTQRYKQLGNAVTVPIVKLVGERIKEYLE